MEWRYRLPALYSNLFSFWLYEGMNMCNLKESCIWQSCLSPSIGTYFSTPYSSVNVCKIDISIRTHSLFFGTVNFWRNFVHMRKSVSKCGVAWWLQTDRMLIQFSSVRTCVSDTYSWNWSVFSIICLECEFSRRHIYTCVVNKLANNDWIPNILIQIHLLFKDK